MRCRPAMTANAHWLCGGGDFEALHCQPNTNFDRSTKLDLTTEPPLLGRYCYSAFFFSLVCFCCVKSYKYFFSKIISFHWVKWIKVPRKPHSTKVNCKKVTRNFVNGISSLVSFNFHM